MTQLWFYFTISLLSSLPLSPVHSLQCQGEREYAWPMDNSRQCCDKCKPGQYLVKRCTSTGNTQCATCPTGQYTDSYNVEPNCPFCDKCDTSRQLSQCETHRNTVCDCQPGYLCTAKACLECKQIPSPPMTTATATVPSAGENNTEENKWLVVISGLLGVGLLLLLLLIFLILRLLNAKLSSWTRPREGFLPNPKTTPQTKGPEEEKEALPVQVSQSLGFTNTTSYLAKELGLMDEFP